MVIRSPGRTDRSVGRVPVVRATRERASRIPELAHANDPAGILRERQRTIGNRLVVASLQRSLVHIRKPTAARPGTISGVTFTLRRPPSNLYGHQGQHLTAYVAFRQTILSNVRDRSPIAAAESLIKVADAFLRLPYMKPLNYWNKASHEGIYGVMHALHTAIATRDRLTVMLALNAQIDELLRARNLIPGTAISEAGTVGHGEATQAGALEIMETHLRTGTGTNGPQQAVKAMWALFDYDPPEPISFASQQIIAGRVLTHLRSMQLAFPLVFAWLTGKPEYHLLPYLRKNRNAFTQLQRLSTATLLKIEEEVHANF